MTAYDLRARQTAAAMLAPVGSNPRAKGQAVTLHQPALTTHDPMTDTSTVTTPAQDHDGSGVELKYDAQSIAAGVVGKADKRLLLSPLKRDGSLMPPPEADSWTATLADGLLYTIKLVTPTRPAGVDVMFELQLRR